MAPTFPPLARNSLMMRLLKSLGSVTVSQVNNGPSGRWAQRAVAPAGGGPSGRTVGPAVVSYVGAR